MNSSMAFVCALVNERRLCSELSARSTEQEESSNLAKQKMDAKTFAVFEKNNVGFRI